MPEEDRETAGQILFRFILHLLPGSEGAHAHTHTVTRELKKSFYHHINLSVCPWNVMRYDMLYTSMNPLFENAAYRF